MFFSHFLTALATSLVLGSVFALVFRGRSPWANSYFFVLIVLLASWAGGLWMPALGPSWGGVPWGTFFLSGLVFGFLLSLLMRANLPSPRGESSGDKPKASDLEQEPRSILGFFVVGFLAISLIALILAWYFLIFLFSPFFFS
jgi:hypothetical protein